jgi:heptosyltransferase III
MVMPLKNVLVVRTDRLGDVLLTLPVCGLLRSAVPDIRIGMLVRTYAAPLLRDNPLVDNVIEYDDARGVPVPAGSLACALRERGYDAAVVARPTARIAWLLARARIPVRIGTGYRWYAGMFTHRVMEHRSTAERHELEYNVRLLRPLGIDVPDRIVSPSFGVHPSAAATAFVSEVLASYGVRRDDELILVHPATGGSSRDWSPGKFRALAMRLAERPATKVCVTGSAADDRVVRKMLSGVSAPLIPLAGVFTLEQLIALVSRASLFVANSTGPLHLAVALNVPVLGFYPPVKVMSARRWGPYTERAAVLTGRGPDDCSACTRGGLCACLDAISVDEAYAAAVNLLVRRRKEKESIPA